MLRGVPEKNSVPVQSKNFFAVYILVPYISVSLSPKVIIFW